MSNERHVTPERWQKIEEFYHSALRREEGQRAEYLREACAGDECCDGKGPRCSHKMAE
jgi:hypothetical protein